MSRQSSVISHQLRAYLAALLLVAPTAAVASQQFTLAQCDTLFALDKSRFLCVYGLYEGANQTGTVAKIYESGSFSNAPDGEYDTRAGARFSDSFRVDGNYVYRFDGWHPLPTNDEALRFYWNDHGVQRVYFCKAKAECVLAPNGEYTTKNGLKIPVKDGYIDSKDSVSICNIVWRAGVSKIECEDRS